MRTSNLKTIGHLRGKVCVVCIQTDVEVEENKSCSVVVEKVVVIVVVVVVVVIVVVLAVVAVRTFIAAGYKFGNSSLDLCTFVHTSSCAIKICLH